MGCGVSFRYGLHSYLTLRNGAKRSVSKGGNTLGADPRHGRGGSVLRIAILRDAPLRYAPQDEVEKSRMTICDRHFW
jgi:hypothetical protein